MNAKEKAKELVDNMWVANKWFSKRCAKQCALICVEEKIKTSNTLIDIKKQSGINVFTEDILIVNYLKEVKQEIEKL